MISKSAPRVSSTTDGATVQLGRPARDGQAKTGAARLGAGTRLAFDKAPEDVQTVGRRNLGAEIHHIGHDGALVFVLVGVDQHGGAVGRMFQRVGDDVGE